MDPWTPPNPKYPPPKPGERPIHRAARTGDHEAIRTLAREGADLNEAFDISLDPGAYAYLATPLMVAAGSGDGATLETVELLLELGADPKLSLTSEEMHGSTSPVVFAASGLGWNYREGGDANRLRRLLQAGSPLPPDPEEANRLLCRTAWSGDPDRVRVLLEHGLDPRGHWDEEKSLERNRESKESYERLRAGDPETLAETPEEFRDAFFAMANFDDSPSEPAASRPSSYQIPLFYAAGSGNEECVVQLLGAGADPLARDDSDRTALYEAGSEAVVRRLIEAGVPLQDRDGFGWSPLDEAVTGGVDTLPRVRGLIAAGADVNATHDRGYTVFMSAASSMERHPEVLRTLAAAGADPHRVTELGYNAFHAAVDVNGEAKEEESVRATFGYLAELGVDLELRNVSGQTPVARAIQEGTGIEVQVLCELGADPDVVAPMRHCGPRECDNSDLPLLFHAALGTGVDRDVKTEALLRAGADPLATDHEGFSALQGTVSALCAKAQDHAGAYTAFLAGLNELWKEAGTSGTTRQEFADRTIPALREYVVRFAAAIPIQDDSKFAEEWREERISCIAALAAHDAWVRSSLDDRRDLDA